MPALIGWAWEDARGAFVWAGLVARVISMSLLASHCHRLTWNSLALHLSREFVRRELACFDSQLYIHRIITRFAHWDGLQNYTDEISARGNLVSGVKT